MRKLDEGLIRRIGKLRRKGYSYRSIARKLSISPTTALKYSKIIRSVGRRHLRKKVNVEKGISVEKIIGHCLFDGSVWDERVSYANSSTGSIVHCVYERYV